MMEINPTHNNCRVTTSRCVVNSASWLKAAFPQLNVVRRSLKQIHRCRVAAL